jgi:hypothetical protein
VNQRYRAAQALGWKTIPTLFVDLDPQRARIWALRDNNSWGEWDESLLAELLAELAADGVELALVGFDSREIDRLLAGFTADKDPDDLPVGCVNSVRGPERRVSIVESCARPVDLEELILGLVALLPGLPLHASARTASSPLGGVQGARDRCAPARALGPASTDTSTAVEGD